MMKTGLLIYGTGQIAKNLTQELGNCYTIHGYVIDDSLWKSASFLDRPCIPFSSLQNGNTLDAHKIFCAIGYHDFNQTRARIYGTLKQTELEIISWIHPTAIVSENATIGKNCYIGPGCIIDFNAQIGDCVSVLPGAIVGHDSEISDNTYICQGVNIPGFVQIHANSFIGTGAIFADGVTIGHRCFVKAGTLVTASCPPESVIGRNGKEEERASLYFNKWYAARESYYKTAI